MSTRDLKAFTDAYVEAALWSSNDESDEQGGEPLDANFGPDDIDPATMRAIERDCASFFEKYGRLVEDDESKAIDKWGRWALAGHDFWLTRNGHGAGFGDGNFPKHDDELYEAAKAAGEFYLYVGDDGVIYAMGHEPPTGVNERRRMPRQHAVRDFNTLPEIIEHAKKHDGATHVLTFGSGATLYFPFETAGGRVKQYEEARLWRERGYWHAPAAGGRKVIDRLPNEAQPIDAYLAHQGGRRAAESRSATPDPRLVETLATDVDSLRSEQGISYEQAYDQIAKPDWVRQYDPIFVGNLVINRAKSIGRSRGRLREAFGRPTQWTDWQILDSIDRGQAISPEAERRAVKLAQLGFIDTTGTWRLTTKGRQTVDRRVPVAAEVVRAGRHRDAGPVSSRHLPRRLRMTSEDVTALASELAVETGGSTPKVIAGGHRWMNKNASAHFTTSSPEYGQKVVVLVSIFEDGSIATDFFGDEGMSETTRYENIGNFSYSGPNNLPEMVEDINWVRKTVDGYAASWEQPEADESRRPAHRPTRRPPSRRARPRSRR